MTRLHLFRPWEALRERGRWDGREGNGWSSARALSATLSQSSCPGMAGDGGDEVVKQSCLDEMTVFGRGKNGGRRYTGA